jgi:hypothetical protein
MHNRIVRSRVDAILTVLGTTVGADGFGYLPMSM